MNQLELAEEIAQHVEPHLEKLGSHLGLTGGVLYKPGQRKDVDFIVLMRKSLNSIKVCQK